MGSDKYQVNSGACSGKASSSCSACGNHRITQGNFQSPVNVVKELKETARDYDGKNRS